MKTKAILPLCRYELQKEKLEESFRQKVIFDDLGNLVGLPTDFKPNEQKAD